MLFVFPFQYINLAIIKFVRWSFFKFSGELHFPSGFQFSTVFTEEERRILDVYGLTMQGLQEGTLIPVSATEHYFLAELDGEFAATSDLARCWRKYSKKVARCELRTSPSRLSRHSSPVSNDSNDSNDSNADSEVLTLDFDDDSDADDEKELDI
jgi:uncharacterized protein YifE (UPF0438 family)